MKTIKKLVYQANDGKIFDNAADCKTYEDAIAAEEKCTTYWSVIHSPDLTEGRGYSGLTHLAVQVAGYGPVQALVEDFCFVKWGKRVGWVQGCQAMQSWIVRKITRTQFWDKNARVSLGDYSYPAKFLKLVIGEREQGLIECEKPLDINNKLR